MGESSPRPAQRSAPRRKVTIFLSAAVGSAGGESAGVICEVPLPTSCATASRSIMKVSTSIAALKTMTRDFISDSVNDQSKSWPGRDLRRGVMPVACLHGRSPSGRGDGSGSYALGSCHLPRPLDRCRHTLRRPDLPDLCFLPRPQLPHKAHVAALEDHGGAGLGREAGATVLAVLLWRVIQG